ncbi:N-acetylmuramoyl-L-alanine amidase [Endozoicomonas sp. Mp262]|uniref:N-acetylmuramoyl-L-alanine amidase n=1 Tax=Endozoicomonas sp. Mp262 TaxID=2919499 RepID=UPI0021D7E55D
MTPRMATLYIIIHCSATRANQPCTIDDIRRWHVQDRGWSDIGYHWVIERNGDIQKGREAHLAGAHTLGYNHCSIGICLVGGLGRHGLPEDNFTPDQMLALEVLVDTLQLRYPGTMVHGHDYFNPYKACPCFSVEDWMDDIK